MAENKLQKIVRLKKEIAALEEELAPLVEHVKGVYADDILEVGEDAIVLYTQHRLAPAKFAKVYPQNKAPQLYKLAPDTTKIRKALTPDQFEAVSSPVRALKVQTLADALADKEKFSEEG